MIIPAIGILTSILLIVSIVRLRPPQGDKTPLTRGTLDRIRKIDGMRGDISND